MGANCAWQKVEEVCVFKHHFRAEANIIFLLFFISVTSRKSSAGSKMVANSKEEENRQTNENGKICDISRIK